MNIRIVSAVLTVILVLSLSTITIFASSALPTISAPTIVYQGSNYIILGSSTASQVTIRIIASSGEIKLFDVQNVVSGIFSKTITISVTGFALGIYTVDVTDINGTSSQNFEVKALQPPCTTPHNDRDDVLKPKPKPEQKPEPSDKGKKQDNEIKEQGKKPCDSTRGGSHFE